MDEEMAGRAVGGGGSFCDVFLAMPDLFMAEVRAVPSVESSLHEVCSCAGGSDALVCADAGLRGGALGRRNAPPLAYLPCDAPRLRVRHFLAV